MPTCLLLLPAAAPASARYGWIINPANGHYHGYSDQIPWKGAEAQAAQWGGLPVTVTDRSEELWLTTQFAAREFLRAGLNELGVEETWEASGGDSRPRATRWHGRLPRANDLTVSSATLSQAKR